MRLYHSSIIYISISLFYYLTCKLLVLELIERVWQEVKVLQYVERGIKVPIHITVIIFLLRYFRLMANCCTKHMYTSARCASACSSAATSVTPLRHIYTNIYYATHNSIDIRIVFNSNGYKFILYCAVLCCVCMRCTRDLSKVRPYIGRATTCAGASHQ